MGLLPCGTRNVLVKSLDYPADVMECCHNFINGNTQKIDVVNATVTANNGTDIVENHRKTITKIFLNVFEEEIHIFGNPLIKIGWVCNIGCSNERSHKVD